MHTIVIIIEVRSGPPAGGGPGSLPGSRGPHPRGGRPGAHRGDAQTTGAQGDVGRGVGVDGGAGVGAGKTFFCMVPNHRRGKSNK